MSISNVKRLLHSAVKWDGFWWMAGIALVLIIGGSFSWVFWKDLRGENESLSTTIRNLGLVIGGVIAIILAIWRSRVAERQAGTAQQSLMNERYQRGAEMLGNSVFSVRMGGIYALQRLAQEYPQQYHIQIMELFCAFARYPTGSEGVTGGPYADEPSDPPKLREDIQAVLTAIARRSEAALACERAANDYRLDLLGADLGGAALQGANLARAGLQISNLAHANLVGANLSGARLGAANLYKAQLMDANFHEADLTEANLSHSMCHRVNLSNAHLNANLSYAHLASANLSGAIIGAGDMTGAILDNAKLSGTVFWDSNELINDDASFGRPLLSRLTQSQLDKARADPDNPPTIPEGAVDVETGEPLVWHGKPLIEEG